MSPTKPMPDVRSVMTETVYSTDARRAFADFLREHRAQRPTEAPQALHRATLGARRL